jgi:hypothetical protein
VRTDRRTRARWSSCAPGDHGGAAAERQQRQRCEHQHQSKQHLVRTVAHASAAAAAAQRRRLSSKNALARAIPYALSRWEALVRYAGDGRLAIDNNVAERALRTIAITRKNFLFLGSEAGGERAASSTRCCKRPS